MTMKPWVARALRRFVGNAAILLAAQEAYYRVLHDRPDLPPAGIDRVELSTFGGTHAVTDPAKVGRIVAIVRSHDGEWTRFPDEVCLLGTPRIVFYQGGAEWGRMVLGPRVIGVRTRHAISTRVLSPADAGELHRLLEAPFTR
jgi:hypothetical protein